MPGNLQSKLDALKEQHLLRQRITLDSPQDIKVKIGGNWYHNYCSNDYLGLANHPAVIEALCKAAKEYGVGAGASHLVNGHNRLHAELEERFAEFVGASAALLFSTGYMANLAVLETFSSRHGTIFEDRLNHASLIEAGLASHGKLVRYPHNDITRLRALIQEHKKIDAITTDTVFSMDGDLAPVQELHALAQKNNCLLYLDDAHGGGVIGATGRGIMEHTDLNFDQNTLTLYTLGKAFGSFGAIVAGDKTLIEALIQFAKPYRYTTALPPAVAAATLSAIAIMQQEPGRHAKLVDNIQYFKQAASSAGLKLMPSNSAIQPLLVGDNEQCLAISEKLLQKNILVTAIRPPTVPANSARLRITLSTSHSQQDIDLLIAALTEILPEELRQHDQ